MTPRFIRRNMEDRGFSPDEIEDTLDRIADEQIQDRIDRDLEDRLTSLAQKGEQNVHERTCVRARHDGGVPVQRV